MARHDGWSFRFPTPDGEAFKFEELLASDFYFIDASPAQALAAAREAAGGLDVRIGGGPATIGQFLAADLIDHMHIALVPILLGRGESLWDGLEGLEERFAIESVSSPGGVTRVTFTRR